MEQVATYAQSISTISSGNKKPAFAASFLMAPGGVEPPHADSKVVLVGAAEAVEERTSSISG
jgi:hypothetical protein